MPINSFLYPGVKVVPPFTVDNSLKFNDGSSDYLTFTPSGNGNRKVFTVSTWVKRGSLGINSNIIGSSDSGFGNGFFIQFQSGDNLRVGFQDPNQFKATNRLFRDVSAWLHIVVAVDVTQSSNSDKIKIYVNGVQETSFSTDNTITNADKNWNNTQAHSIGRSGAYNSQYFDGYLAEVVNIDGLQLDATSFGEFDEDTGIWKPIDVSGLTFGTNGFYLDFEDSSSLGNDANGSNNFTVNNLTSIDQSLDTCENNFCTWNILYRTTSEINNGNLVYNSPASNPVFGSLTSFGVNAGKWYAECKYVSGSNHYGILGVADEVFATLNDLGSNSSTDLGKTGASLGSDPNDCTIAYVINTGAYRNNNSNTSWGSAGGDGDIINIALDRDNRKVYFGVNGTYGNSSNPASGTNGIDLSSLVTGDTYFLGVTNDTGSSETVLDFNFGAGFGKTAVSSGNADANGYGNFEYAPPSGFSAWNSKNLGEFG